jgi:hypothetical protein
MGTTILQNGLKTQLPASFLSEFPTGAEISYAIIPIVRTLPEPLQGQVRAAFATSISHIWYAVVGLGALGLLSVLPMRNIELHVGLDENWGFEARDRPASRAGAEDGTPIPEGDTVSATGTPVDLEKGPGAREKEAPTHV